MKRKIFERLIDWKNTGTKPLMILGARQVGKTYTTEEFCRNEFEKFMTVNLLHEPNIVSLYSSTQNSEDKYRQLKMLVNFDPEKPGSVLFVDEVQESEELIADLKFFNEQHPKARIIVAGSLLGIKLKRMKKRFRLVRLRC